MDATVRKIINMENNQMKRFALLVSVLFIGLTVFTSSVSFAASTPKKAADSVGTKKAAVSKNEDKGVGPIKSVTLGPINKKLAEEGESQFDQKCMSCHRLDSRLVGPALENVTKERSPEFIMNMMLNSSVMEEKDPIAEKLLDEYHVPMVVPGITKHQARAILEYLRSKAPK